MAISAGSIITAADITDAITHPFCKVSRSTTISVPASTPTLMTWSTDDRDAYGMHSTVTNTSRLVCVRAGLHRVEVLFNMAASTTNARQCILRKNAAGSSSGGTLIETQQPTQAVSGSMVIPLFTYADLVVDDYVEWFFNQTTSGALNAQAGWATMIHIAD